MVLTTRRDDALAHVHTQYDKANETVTLTCADGGCHDSSDLFVGVFLVLLCHYNSALSVRADTATQRPGPQRLLSFGFPECRLVKSGSVPWADFRQDALAFMNMDTPSITLLTTSAGP